MAAPEETPAAIRRNALLAMVAPTAVLVLAATATASRQAATWFGMRGPICPLGHLLGEHACPGCGLTRGTSMAVQGHWHDAWAVNPGGFVVAALCVAAILLHADVWRRARVLDGHLRLRSLGRWFFLVGILLAWALRASGGILPA
ncbi:MAG: DUF2752 domain-containing protein [Planctomycetes bacterium]|nr:DUF2752 domain-containing protein [Planctomycetota bacterium]